MRLSQSLIAFLSVSLLIILMAFPAYANTDGFANSVRLAGMGEAGVAITDGNSAFYNPAQISFPLNDYDLYVTGSPGRYTYYKRDFLDENMSRANVSVIANILDRDRGNSSRIRVSAGFEYTDDITNGVAFSYLYPDGTGSAESFEFRDKRYRAILGFGLKNAIPMSCAMSINWFKIDGGDARRSVDLGVLFGLPSGQMNAENIPAGETRFCIYPSIGFAIQQMGLKKIDSYYSNDKEETPIKRYGGAAKFSWDTGNRQGRFSRFYVMPSIESLSQYETDLRFGVELGVYDAIQLRYGHKGTHRYSIKNTYGLSLSSRGIARWLSNSHNGSQSVFTRKLDVRFEYAYQKYVGASDGFNFIGISLAY